MQYNRIEYKRKVLTLKFKIKVNLRQKFPPCASLFSTWEWRFPIGDSRNGNVKKCPRKSGEYERRELREMMGLTMSLAVRSDCQATCYFRRFVKIWWESEAIEKQKDKQRKEGEKTGTMVKTRRVWERLAKIGNFIDRSVVSSSILRLNHWWRYLKRRHTTWTWFWTRTRQTRGWSRFLRSLTVSILLPPAVSPPEILLPDIGSYIFYDRVRYTGPLMLKKPARGQIEREFSDRIALC